MARYVIYGAGAIGGALGASLFENGHEVVLIARGDHYKALATTGIEFSTPNRTIKEQIPAVDHPSKIEFRPDDVVLLCAKSQDTLGAIRDLSASADNSIAVVCVQNGVENERMMLRVFPNTYGAMIICPATFLSPGVVEVDSSNKLGIVAIGRYPHGADELSKQVAADLTGSGWYSESTEAIQDWKYAKLIDNLTNATQVVLGLEARGGEIADRAKAEGIAVLDAAKIPYLDLTRFRELRSANVTPGSRGGIPRGASTWQSVARGTGSVETDYLNGEIVLLGRQFGIPTPVNGLLQQLTNEIAAGRRQPGSISEEMFLARV